MSEERFEPERVRRKLSELTRSPRQKWHQREGLPVEDLSEAGVLIPLAEKEGELHVLFTHRSQDMEKHSGEVSFPGGHVEPEDNTLVETALREAYEEVGLHPSDVEVYGAVTELPTVTGFRIEAFAGEYPHPYELIPCPREIETIFEAPLSALADPAIHRVEEREYAGQVFPVHFFDYDGHVIWGATGYMLHTFLEFLELIRTDEET
jgi:8-oxo-dGTP pyrophosphatase MutT (NUDIX family)